MARTPLFSRLQKTLWLASEIDERGIGVAEALERREAFRLSRRRALQALGVATGALAVGTTGCAAETADGADAEPASGVTSSALKKARIVIVGAGLAGLTTAYRLAQRGFDPHVYEAGKRVGGRAFTLRQGGFPTKVELGGELIDTGHKELRALATELGLTVLDQGGATADLQLETYFFGTREYTEEQALEDFLPVAKILRQDWKAQGADYATYDNTTPGAIAADRLSIEDWLDKNGIRGRMRKLLSVAYTSEYGREIDEQSFLNLLYLIGRKPPPLELFGESDERYTIKEGNDAVATRIADALRTDVAFEHVLVAVKNKADGTVAAVFENRGRTVEVVADKLVLALPFTQLRKCDLSKVTLSPAKKLSIETVPYGTNAKLMIATNKRPWQAQGASGTAFTDAVFQECWDSSRGYPTTGAVMTSFTGGDLGLAVGRGTVNARADDFAAQLDKIFPGSKAAFTGKAVRMHWPTTPFFEGSYACYAPGDWTTYVGSEQVVEGNIHFCGEHTSLDYQGFLNGAVESGERVAKEIRRALRDAAAA